MTASGNFRFIRLRGVETGCQKSHIKLRATVRWGVGCDGVGMTRDKMPCSDEMWEILWRADYEVELKR